MTSTRKIKRILRAIRKEAEEIISESVFRQPLDERMGALGNRIRELADIGIEILKQEKATKTT